MGIKIKSAQKETEYGSVTAKQCVQATLRKCTSEVIYGHLKHECIGVASSILMDMMPFETRLFGTGKLYERLEEVSGGE